MAGCPNLVRGAIKSVHQRWPRSSIARQLPAPPARVFARGVEHPFAVTVHSPHDADPSKHRWTALLCHEDQAFHCCLPFWGRMIGLRELGDVGPGILQRDERATAGQRDRFVELAFPTAISRHAAALSSLSGPRATILQSKIRLGCGGDMPPPCGGNAQAAINTLSVAFENDCTNFASPKWPKLGVPTDRVTCRQRRPAN